MSKKLEKQYRTFDIRNINSGIMYRVLISFQKRTKTLQCRQDSKVSLRSICPIDLEFAEKMIYYERTFTFLYSLSA